MNVTEKECVSPAITPDIRSAFGCIEYASSPILKEFPMSKVRFFTALFSIAFLAACGDLTPTASEDPPEVCLNAEGEVVDCFGGMGSGN